MAKSSDAQEATNKSPTSESETEKKRTRTVRAFPASTFDEALQFAKQIYEFGSGTPVRRLTFFNQIGKSPDSSASRQAIVNSNRYGLTKGAYNAEQLELTAEGIKSVADGVPKREQARTRVKLAIEGIENFNALYQRIVNTKLPARAALIDQAKDIGIDSNQAEEFVDTFIVNLRSVGLLQVLSGADRVVTVEHLLDSLSSGVEFPIQQGSSEKAPVSGRLITTEVAQFEKSCFYVSPIGDDGSPERLHADLFLGSLIEPALEPFKLEVVRADKIDKPGFITKQVIDYLVRSRLVIADLSFHNPNVFYELAIRHAIRKPIVQIIRRGDRIPFDVNQSRTVIIDNTSIYTLVPMIDAYRSEIANQVRRALENPDDTDTPLSIFYPNFTVLIQ